MTAPKKRAQSTAFIRIRDIGAPYEVARQFLFEEFTSGEFYTLHHHKGEFWAWDGAAYHSIGKDELKSKLYAFLDRCKTGTGEGEKVKPDTALVTRVLDAIAARAQLHSGVNAPAWLTEGASVPADAIIACKNGLLHLPTQTLLPHTPAFFTHNAVPFDFNPHAPPPEQWMKFLTQLWPDDPEAITTLREIFGYCLTGDTSQQKAFMIVGPTRSGKGTISRVLLHLVGQDNVSGSNLTSLSTNFGLAPLIGKRVAIVPDARLSGRADQGAIAERLLSITGEDNVTIDRKYLSAWTGRLSVRFVILSNEPPQLADASGALAGRFVTLVMKESFLGKEDRGLFNRFLPEFPGILNWAIAGWQSLQARGHFIVPKSSAEMVRQFADLGSPIRAFVRDHCTTGPAKSVETGALFTAWCDWCRQQNRSAGTVAQFGRDLHAAVPGIKVMQPRSAAGRSRVYQGIGLQSAGSG